MNLSNFKKQQLFQKLEFLFKIRLQIYRFNYEVHFQPFMFLKINWELGSHFSSNYF